MGLGREHARDGCAETSNMAKAEATGTGAQRREAVVEKACNCHQRQASKAEKEHQCPSSLSWASGGNPTASSGAPPAESAPGMEQGRRAEMAPWGLLGGFQHSGVQIGEELQSFEHTNSPVFTQNPVKMLYSPHGRTWPTILILHTL